MTDSFDYVNTHLVETLRKTGAPRILSTHRAPDVVYRLLMRTRRGERDHASV